MIELSPANAAKYLSARSVSDVVRVTELGGGVSNTVLLIETADGGRFILKQSLGKLRVEQEWLSDRTRIFREAAGLRAVAPAWPQGAAPVVLFEDRENFAFAMTAAPAEAVTWKEQLLGGVIEEETARRVGELLAAMMRAAAPDEFRDQTVFHQLRIDPYYRATAARHPDLAGHFDRLIAGTRAVGLVHGDWSPKNLLVWPGGLMAIDFEVVHYGDPAFDVAFLIKHLLLKACYRPQDCERYARAATAFLQALPEWETPALQHLGALLLARIDGKSPVEYLRDAALRDRVRQFARKLIQAPPPGVAEVFQQL